MVLSAMVFINNSTFGPLESDRQAQDNGASLKWIFYVSN